MNAGDPHRERAILLREALESTQRAAEEPKAIFLYGTLMRGEPARHKIERYRVTRVEDAEIKGRLIGVDWYPGLVLDGSARVKGEWTEVEDLPALLEELDRYEEFSGYTQASPYWRLIRPVYIGSVERSAWVYVYTGSVEAEQEIIGGDWRSR